MSIAEKNEAEVMLQLRENEEIEIVELIDESQEKHQFAVLAAVVIHDQEYVMLSLLKDLEADDGTDLEVFLFERQQDDSGNTAFCSIDDEDLFAEVRDLCASMMAKATGDVAEA